MAEQVAERRVIARRVIADQFGDQVALAGWKASHDHVQHDMGRVVVVTSFSDCG